MNDKSMTTFLLKRSLLIAAMPIPLLNARGDDLSKLESSFGGRIGVYAINTANNEKIQYRAEERFPFGSTCKVMVVSDILTKSERDPTLLQRHIKYTQKYINASSGYRAPCQDTCVELHPRLISEQPNLTLCLKTHRVYRRGAQ